MKPINDSGIGDVNMGNLMLRISLLVLCTLLGFLLAACENKPAAEAANSGVPLAPFQTKKVYVIRMGSNYDEGVMVAGIQGLAAAKGNEHVYVIPNHGNGEYTRWLEVMKKDFGVEDENVFTPWELLKKYDDKISGYILYKTQYKGQFNIDPSVNVATSLAHQLNAVPISTSLEKRAKQAGLKCILDVSEWDEKRLLESKEHMDKIAKNVMLEQKPLFSYQNRDYAIMSNAFTFSTMNTSLRDRILDHLLPNSPVFGWGEDKFRFDGGQGEYAFVAQTSKHSCFTIPSDHAANMSVLSGVRMDSIRQKQSLRPEIQAQDKHYVCFMMTDGDNLQWVLGGFNQTNWFGNENRGKFGMGWGLPATMIDIAAPALKWYYEKATDRDSFILQLSGLGYMYPSRFDDGALDQQVSLVNKYMERSGMNIIQVMDNGHFNDAKGRKIWDKYTAQPNIDALFYIDYSPYHRYKGQIFRSNEKPVISARYSLWRGFNTTERLAAKLNAETVNPGSEEGYSLVCVHAWYENEAGRMINVMNEVNKVYDMLDKSRVEVVTPQEFAQLINRNVKK